MTTIKGNLLTCQESVVYHLRRSDFKIVVGLIILRSLVWLRVIPWKGIEVPGLFAFTVFFLFSRLRGLKERLCLILGRLVLLLLIELRFCLICTFSTSLDFNLYIIS